MRIRLGQVEVALCSDSEVVHDAWRRLLPGPPEIVGEEAPLSPHITLELQLTDELSAPAASDRIYEDPQGIVDVYRGAQRSATTLHFRRGGLVHLSPDQPHQVWGQITPAMFRHGQIEDVTFTGIAPSLRQFGYYLLHAAAVVTENSAVLLVGPSHSGKTTTGLALVLSGWKHLASDVVVLSKKNGNIVAYPAPGAPRVRPASFDLLPGLRAFVATQNETNALPPSGLLSVPPENWALPAPVKTICFPQVSGTSSSALQPLKSPLAVARLLEESVDRWDRSTLLQHIEFITALGQQARTFQLSLAPDMHELPGLLKGVL